MTDFVKNLRLYIGPKEYEIWAGGDWPTYDEFMAGVRPTHPIAVDLVNKMIHCYVVEKGIRFPIKTKTACQSKWTWSTIYLNQLSTASCHRVKPIKFELEDFDNFHNIPKKLNDRKLMLEGKWPTGGCEYCKNIEDAGGWSDRQHNLEIANLTPVELETDPTAIVVSPKIVEIFAQNICNFACVYCNSQLSSRIEQENIKFGSFNKNGVSIPLIDKSTVAAQQYFDKFIDWLVNNITKLSRLHLLGGETFIQHNLMNSVLEIIKQHPNPNLEFCIFSNMCAPNKYWNLYIEKIKKLQQDKKIKVFDLTASIDNWGKEAEYTRFGLDLTLFEKRLEWASKQGNWLRININQTVTAMTIKTMPALIEKIKQFSGSKHIGHYFQFYTGSQMFQHPQIFSYDFWKDSFVEIYKVMPINTVHQQEAVLRMQGLEKLLQQTTKNNMAEIKKLHIYLDELDRRRGTNWRTIFPYFNVTE